MAMESQDTKRVSTVRMISQSQSPQMEATASPPSNPVFLQQMLASLTAIATLLSARFLLLIAGIGAFSLAYLSVSEPNSMKLAVNGVYDMLVFVPLTYLYATRG